jgi:hypothetical protein
MVWAVRQMDEQWSHCWLRQQIFIFSKEPRGSLATNQPSTHRRFRPLFSAVRRPENESDNLHSSSTDEAKNLWSYAWNLIWYRDNLTFYIYSPISPEWLKKTTPLLTIASFTRRLIYSEESYSVTMYLNRWARGTDYVLEKSLPLPGIKFKFPDFQAGGLDNYWQS